MIEKVASSCKKHIALLIIGPLIKMIEAVFDLLIPLFMKAVIDLVFDTSSGFIDQSIGEFIKLFGVWIPSSTSLNYIVIGGTIILLMGIVGFLTTMVCQYIAAVVSTNIGSEIRMSLYQKILSLGKKEIEQFGMSKLLTILNTDSFQVQQGILLFVRLAFRAPFIILGSLVISFVLNWQIGLVFLAIIPFIFAIVFFITYKVSKKYLVVQSKLDDLSLKTSDTISGYKVIRAFNKQEFEDESFKEKTTEFQDLTIKISKLNSLINPLTFAVVSLAMIAICFIGGLQMQNGVVILGSYVLPSTIITLVTYLASIFQTLILLTNLILIFTKSLVSKKRVDEALSIKPSIVEKEDSIIKSIDDNQEIFSFEDVSLKYIDSGNETLKDISFKLFKGQQLGIIGPTGSGKSTLVNMMDRFIEPTKGKILYKGVDIKDYSLKRLRDEISFVFQKSNLFKGTIRSNLLLADPLSSDEEIVQVLKDSLAWNFVKEYPETIDHNVEEKGSNFSGGQKQRLCIARGLIKKPEVLILDDSTSALDLLTDKTVRDNIGLKYPDLTKVIISQRIATIKDSDLILVFEKGQIIASGKHEELLKSCKSYYETYDSQLEKGSL